jgi:pimeloyl-ACP methyl ester carboxylesterase
MPYATVNGLRLYYEQARPSALVAAGGTGPPLVLLNGGTGTIDAPVNGGGWGPLRTYFAQRYHVVHVEHRGHGRTDNPGRGRRLHARRAGGGCRGADRAPGVGAGPRGRV